MMALVEFDARCAQFETPPEMATCAVGELESTRFPQIHSQN